MTGKTELLTNFYFSSIPTIEMLHKEIQSLCKFSFLKIVKIELTNKVHSFFSKRDAFSARKTSLVISFTSLIGIEWTKASLVDTDLSNMAQLFIYFLEKHLKKFFVLPRLPSNEKNSSDHHNSYNKDPNLVFFSFTESSSNSLPTIKIPKKSYHIFLLEQHAQNKRPKFGLGRTLGIRCPQINHVSSKCGYLMPFLKIGMQELEELKAKLEIIFLFESVGHESQQFRGSHAFAVTLSISASHDPRGYNLRFMHLALCLVGAGDWSGHLDHEPFSLWPSIEASSVVGVNLHKYWALQNNRRNGYSSVTC